MKSFNEKPPGDQGKEGAHDLIPAADPGDGLNMKRVNGKKQGRHQAVKKALANLFKQDKDEKFQEPGARQKSALRQWPVQITLVPPNAPYFQGADLVVTADCVPVAYANFHADFLTGKSVLMGCPKLDDLSSYQEKMTEIFTANDIKSVTVLTMEVPCCTGLQHAVEAAIKAAGKEIPLNSKVISIQGDEN